MPDLFGKKQLGRATTGGRFYATPSERVEAGAVYFPDESSLLFGVAEYTVEAGNLGAFATEGTFVFEKPSDWLDSLGRKVFFRPSTGEIVNQDQKGDVLIGFQVLANVPDDKLGVVLTQGENSVVIIVTSTADSGAGSLRQAIADAQDGDVILFDADVFPVGTTTSILLSSYITVNKSVSIYGGESDGNGGYTSGAEKRYYVYREIDGVKTKVYIDDDNPAQEGETVLFENVCRVALDGQEAVRCLYANTNNDSTCMFCGVAFINGTNAQAGGGIYTANTSRNILTDCVIENCVCSANGGGIYMRGTSNTTLNNCVILGCVCGETYSGGGVFTQDTSQNTLNDCVITNCSGNSGGGIYVAGQSNTTLTDCTISGCSANYGGGLYSTNTSQNTLTDCNISGCSANIGGGLYSYGTSQNTLTDCTISGCSANYGGGVYTRDTSQNTLNDCTITNCNATTNGGGVFSSSDSQNALTNCVFESCTATNGGAIRTGSSSAANIVNCKFKNSSVYFADTSSAVVSASDFDALTTGPNSAVCFASGVSTVAAATINAATITINDGAALTITDTATIGAATFTSEGRGYLATAAGIDISSATLTNVVACTYGAGLESFEISEDGATWTAQDLTTPILLEKKGDGDVWTTLSDDATGGSYSDSFEIGTTLRAFDGVRFFVASLDAYWQVEPFVVASNGGGGAGDVSPSWTIQDATITPNAEEV